MTGPCRRHAEFAVHPRYILVYEIIDQRVFILALVHTARQWPPISPGPS